MWRYQGLRNSRRCLQRSGLRIPRGGTRTIMFILFKIIDVVSKMMSFVMKLMGAVFKTMKFVFIIDLFCIENDELLKRHWSALFSHTLRTWGCVFGTKK